MLRLLIDENLDHRILRGLKLRFPALDFVVVQDTELKGKEDPPLLAWAAEENRILLTHES
jgi:predicted nuclease of predicted toxin-antitoxin system